MLPMKMVTNSARYGVCPVSQPSLVPFLSHNTIIAY